MSAWKPKLRYINGPHTGPNRAERRWQASAAYRRATVKVHRGGLMTWLARQR